MGRAVSLRDDFDGSDLRRLARLSKAAALHLHRINVGQDIPHLPVIETKFG